MRHQAAGHAANSFVHPRLSSRRLPTGASLLRGVVLAVLALWLASPTSAHADTIGQTYTVGAACSPNLMWVDPSYTVPRAGTITSFSFQSRTDFIYGGAAGAQLAFKVLRPEGGGRYTVVGTTPLETLQTWADLETFTPSAPIAVRRGDVLGYWVGDYYLPGCMTWEEGEASAQFSGNLAPGASLEIPLCCYGHLNVSAEWVPLPTPPAPHPLALDAGSDTGASSGDGVTRDSTPTFTGNAKPASTVTIYVDGVPAG